MIKVGDRVRCIDKIKGFNPSIGYVQLCGLEGKVIDVRLDSLLALVTFDVANTLVLSLKSLEKLEEVKEFTKADLKDGMFVEYRNPVVKNKKRVVIGNEIYTVNASGFTPLNELNDDLTHKDFGNYDIMKVYDRGELIWEREEAEEVEEMTMQQVCEALGKDIKIVKG